jgi:3-hydroxyisobutyrate dehydrogenase
MDANLQGTTEPTVSPIGVAVIGLGAMGLPMALRLAGSYRVNGYDPVEANARQALDGGVNVLGTPMAAAEGMGVVILAVRTLAQVESALFDDDGVVAGLDAGKLVVLTSTVGAPGARVIGEKLAERDIVLLDLPVSGGPLRARQGDLLALVSGNADAIEAARPVLERLASTIVTVGDHAGDGQAMKTVNQLLCGVHIAAAAEALSLAQGLGIDPQAALDALSAGAASSFMLSNRGPRIVQTLRGDDPEVLSRVDIFVKDMGIVTDAGRATHVALPVAAATEQLFQLGAAAGFEAKDDSTIAAILARRTT